MDRLELELRELLTDDRLDVPIRVGAVQSVHRGVRRRRRRRAVAMSAAAGVVVAATVATSVVAARGDHTGDAAIGEKPHLTSPTPVQSATKPPAPVGGDVAATIPWAPIAYTGPTPFPYPGTVANTSVPWCNGKSVTASASEFQGATGSAAGAVTIVNNGGTCAVQGMPNVTGYDANGKPTALPVPHDDFTVHPWFTLDAGQRATTSVQIFGDTAPCILGPVKRLTLDLGHGGRTISTDIGWAGGGDVKPRCGTVPASQQIDHYTVLAGSWARPDGSPSLPGSGVTPGIGRTPRTVMQGAIINYQVTLPELPSLRPCLPFLEQLVSVDGRHTVLASQTYLLPCDAMQHSGAARGYVLEMQLALPGAVATGDATIVWATPLPDQVASDGPTIHITAAPPLCDEKKLDFSTGPNGAATTHYKQVIVITNRSQAACSLRGYPGVQFINADGHNLRTVPHHGSSFTWETDTYQTIRLRPGGTASFALGGVDYDALHDQACPVASVVKLIAPEGFTQVPLQINWPYCLRGKVDVSPVVAGPDGPR